jgi:hypothetical protein
VAESPSRCMLHRDQSAKFPKGVTRCGHSVGEPQAPHGPVALSVLSLLQGGCSHGLQEGASPCVFVRDSKFMYMRHCRPRARRRSALSFLEVFWENLCCCFKFIIL